MYIPPLIDKNASIHENHILYEKTLLKKLKINNGKVLDLGCGSGKISNHISLISNSDLYGINITASHIETAKRYAKNINNKKVHYQVASFNDPLKFKDNFFDAAYDLGAIIYSYDLKKTFAEIYRTLKPGGRYLTLSPVILDNFDKNNTLHLYNLNCCRMIGLWTYGAHYKYFEQIGEEVGFKIVSSKPRDVVGSYEKILDLYHYYYVISELGIKFKIVPSALRDILKSMCAIESKQCIEAEKQKICNVSYEIIFEKPFN